MEFFLAASAAAVPLCVPVAGWALLCKVPIAAAWVG